MPTNQKTNKIKEHNTINQSINQSNKQTSNKLIQALQNKTHVKAPSAICLLELVKASIDSWGKQQVLTLTWLLVAQPPCITCLTCATQPSDTCPVLAVWPEPGLDSLRLANFPCTSCDSETLNGVEPKQCQQWRNMGGIIACNGGNCLPVRAH